MASVVLQHSFNDGRVLHPAGMYVQVPDEVMATILKGEYESPSFLESIKRKVGRPKKDNTDSGTTA